MNKKLVAYFSASGTTARVAKNLAQAAAGLKASVAADTAIVEEKILNGANSVDSLQKWVETIL